jgi:hypothetical protein
MAGIGLFHGIHGKKTDRVGHQELDAAQDSSNRLEEANREVSRRLVTAMETIRAVLDR